MDYAKLHLHFLKRGVKLPLHNASLTIMYFGQITTDIDTRDVGVLTFLLSYNQCNIGNVDYNPLWWLLSNNLVVEMHSSSHNKYCANVCIGI